MKSRRDLREYERLPQNYEAHLTWALSILMTPASYPQGAPRRLVQDVGREQLNSRFRPRRRTLSFNPGVVGMALDNPAQARAASSLCQHARGG